MTDLLEHDAGQDNYLSQDFHLDKPERNTYNVLKDRHVEDKV